ncbi:MAG TPA: glycosyltransferase domain-containing protein [Puia sp.]|nr:glycosyltransferase domain-containing protein [Puia sp.]
MKKPKIVVYTAIAGGYDSLKPVLPLWQDEATFVAFLDKPQRVPGWEIRTVHEGFKDPCRNAKIHKILPHKFFPDADYSLWIDGCVRLKSIMPLRQWIKEYLAKHDQAQCKHWGRDCIYQEGGACLQYHWDLPAIIHRQMDKYFSEGYPRNNGLGECTVIFRRHTQAVENLNELWWKEISEGSRRDQLSFNYVCHKLGFKYTHLPGTILNNPHFHWLPHTSDRSKPTPRLAHQRRSSVQGNVGGSQ